MSKAMPFERRRKLALAILTDGERLSRRAGSFLGQLIADPTPMSEAQADWFAQLVERAGIDAQEGL